jgi:hypothetical protein
MFSISYRTRLVRVQYDLNLTRGCHRFYYLAPLTVFDSFSHPFLPCQYLISVVSDVRERLRDLGSPLRFMLRRSSLVECVSELYGIK